MNCNLTTQRRLVVFLVGAVAVILLTGASTPVPGAQLEKFNAVAMVMGNVATGANARLDIVIDRWSTEAEGDELEQILVEQGQPAFVRALAKLDSVGWIRERQSLRYELRYAREITGPDGGRSSFYSPIVLSASSKLSSARAPLNTT